MQKTSNVSLVKPLGWWNKKASRRGAKDREYSLHNATGCWKIYQELQNCLCKQNKQYVHLLNAHFIILSKRLCDERWRPGGEKRKRVYIVRTLWIMKESWIGE